MKNVNRFYLVLIVGGAIAAIIALASLYGTGSAAVPGWRTAFQPGALSSGHSFLDGKCESCHTAARGVEAAACIKCHASTAADLAKQPTAFHATIQDCRGCHSEHQGGERPTRMDHAALERIGSHVTVGTAGHAGVTRQMLADMADFLGVSLAQTEQSSLDCASCHGNQDTHRELFGTECADAIRQQLGASRPRNTHLPRQRTARNAMRRHQAIIQSTSAWLEWKPAATAEHRSASVTNATRQTPSAIARCSEPVCTEHDGPLI